MCRRGGPTFSLSVNGVVATRPFAPGDLISIQVVTHPELSVKKARGDSEGRIVVPA